MMNTDRFFPMQLILFEFFVAAAVYFKGRKWNKRDFVPFLTTERKYFHQFTNDEIIQKPVKFLVFDTPFSRIFLVPYKIMMGLPSQIFIFMGE